MGNLEGLKGDYCGVCKKYVEETFHNNGEEACLGCLKEQGYSFPSLDILRKHHRLREAVYDYCMGCECFVSGLDEETKSIALNCGRTDCRLFYETPAYEGEPR